MMDLIYLKLKKGGTVWVNLGDTYGTQSGNMRNPVGGYETRHAKETIKVIQPKTIHKCLLLIPHRFAIGCIDRGWIMRNDVIWAKRNGMPESVTDRFSKKHEYFFFMVKSEKYYFDLDAIKDRTVTKDTLVRDRDTTKLNNTPGRSKMGGLKENQYDTKNPGSVSDFWDILTKPSSEKHYASYNDSLLLKPMLAGCPEGGIVYDPFMGTGSTAEVALRSNRNFIGSEMSKEYCEIANKRLEPFKLQQKLKLV
jgi:DNA modification methylase